MALVQAHLAAGRLDEALAAADEALRSLGQGGEDDGRRLRVLRAGTLLELGRVLEARAAAEAAVEAAPESADAHAILGDTWLADDPARAEARYRKSLALEPGQPRVLNDLGVALIRQRRRAEAAQAFRAALRLDPALVMARRNVFGASHPIRLAPWHGILAAVLWLAGTALLVAGGVLDGAGGARAGRMGLVFLALSVAAAAWTWRVGRRRLAAEDPSLLALQFETLVEMKAGRLRAPPRVLRMGGGALVVFGLATAAGCFVLGVVELREYLALPAAPVRRTAETARPGEWVTLEDTVLDCATQVELRGRVYALGKSKAGRPVVVGGLEVGACQPSPAGLVGVLTDLHPNLARTLAGRGFEVPDGPAASLCTSCGPGATLALAGVIFLGVLIGGWLAVYGRALWRSSRPLG